jgi:hypothetical protein
MISFIVKPFLLDFVYGFESINNIAVKGETMKNTFLSLSMIVLALLTGCGTSNEPGKTNTTITNASTTNTEQVSEINTGSLYGIHYELGDFASDFTDTPDAAKAGDSVEIRMGVLYDADIHLYLDAQELEKSHQDSDYWGYTFTMPDKDVVITAKAYTKDEMASSSENTKVPLGNVQYVRTDGYRDDVQYPKTLWITSLEEMNTYVEANQELYHLNSNGFTDAVKQYDDHYFEKNDLIIVLLEEGSGSIEHRVLGLTATPLENQEKHYELQPMIQRTIPEVGTDDMAEWHILIEISKEHGASESKLLLPSITNVHLSPNWNEP